MGFIKILLLNRLFSSKSHAVLVKQCVGSVNNNVSLNRVTRVSNQYFEILIELVNTCCFLISVIYDLMVKHGPLP